jgi:hypothetical protein
MPQSQLGLQARAMLPEIKMQHAVSWMIVRPFDGVITAQYGGSLVLGIVVGRSAHSSLGCVQVWLASLRTI